ncbi:MAG: hypothetical protein AAGI11_05065 [Pseudomonadota bacterium]
MSLPYAGPEQVKQLQEQIDPQTFKDYPLGPSATVIVEQWPDRPGRGIKEYKLVFYDLASGEVSPPVSLGIHFPATIVNEPDTLRDLAIMFGMPPEGVRIGGRRHAQMVMNAILDGDAETAGLLYAGAGLRWLLNQRHDDVELQAFEGHGGTWSEYGHFGNFDIALNQLVWTVAMNRRNRILETGFDRAALALLRAWTQANLEWLGEQAAESERSRKARNATKLSPLIAPAAPGAGYLYDPPDVRKAWQLLVAADEPSAIARYLSELEAAVARYPEGRPEGRFDLGKPQSSVDPSDVADVRIDLLRALDLTDPVVYSKLAYVPAQANAYCVGTERPDPRSLDRVDLTENTQQLVAELFDAASEAESTFLEELSDYLWRFPSGGRDSMAWAECQVGLMNAAYWGSASSQEKGADRLIREMTLMYPAGSPADVPSSGWDQLEVNVYLSVSMLKAPDGPFGSPASVMAERMRAFIDETAVLRDNILSSPRSAEQKNRMMSDIAWRYDLEKRWGLGNAGDSE